jgi:pimeloyl-ACP methyl ester carboxylesterase
MNELLIETPNGRICGQAAGDPAGPLVLGIHGWSQRNGSHTWQPLLEPLAAAGFCAVTVDMPGWGKSDAWDSGLLTTGRAVAAVLAIMDGLNKPTASLMGKSWGGGVALQVALDHPSRVERLILTAPAFNQFDRLAGLSQPVLLAWAKDDPVIRFETAERFVAAIPNARLESYHTGGHSAALKNAADFGPKAVAFLLE